jgi:hypothetical protein
VAPTEAGPQAQPIALGCGDFTPRDEAVTPVEGGIVAVGPMSEEASQAKRLYSPRNIAHFDHPTQREIFFRASYLMGLDRHVRARFSEAATLFDQVRPDAPDHRAALACRRLVAAAKH